MDLSSGVVIPSFALETKQEEPVEDKLDKTVDFEKLIGGKEAHEEEAKKEKEKEKEVQEEEEKKEIREAEENKQGTQDKAADNVEKRVRSRSADDSESKRARLDTRDSANEFVYSLNEQRKENWIRKGLEVKILNDKLANGKLR